MTWNCIPYTFSLEEAAGCSPTHSSDTDLSELSKSKKIPEKYCSQDSLTEPYLDSLFGTTSDRFESTTRQQERTSDGFRRLERNSSSVAGSRNCAKTSAQQAKGQGSQVKNQDSGWKWPGSFARYDRDTCSLKTRQLSLLGDSELYSETLPQWGLMLDGELLLLPMSELPIFERESGLLPTPTVTDHKGSTPYRVQRRERLNNGFTLREWLGKFSKGNETVYPSPGFLENMQGFPEGWTELKPLETHKYQQWLRSHGEYYAHQTRKPRPIPARLETAAPAHHRLARRA